MTRPSFVDAIEKIEGVERVEWSPADDPDPGNPNAQDFNSIFITPVGELPYNRNQLETLRDAAKGLLQSRQFSVDETVIFDDGVELRESGR